VAGLGVPLTNLSVTNVQKAHIYDATDGDSYPSLTLGPVGATTVKGRLIAVPDLFMSSNLQLKPAGWTADDVTKVGAVATLQSGQLVFYSSPVGANPRTVNSVLTVTSAGIMGLAGEIRERGRSIALGDWINIPYSAANFSAAGGTTPTWVVEAGDIQANGYTIIGRTVFFSFGIVTSTITGSPTSLRIALPALGAVQRLHLTVCRLQESTTDVMGYAYAYPTIAYISIYKPAQAAFVNGTNTLTVQFQLAVEMF
jgi:hypothetical protein